MANLNTVQISALAKAGGKGRHAVGNPPGLYLQVAGQWVSWLFRFQVNGKSRQMGLGAYPEVSLAQARAKALAQRGHIAAGVDPLMAAAAQKAAAKVASPTGPDRDNSTPTFRQAAERYITAHEAGWRNFKHVQQWRNTLASYAYPRFGDKPVDQVSTDDVKAALEPIWSGKTETAARLRGRIETILDAAKALGWRTGENPARWRGHLALWLPAKSRVAKADHHAALDWRRVPAMLKELEARQGMAAKALRFAILTAARSGEVRGATWDEIDLQARLWAIPAARMKAGREHRVPLSDAALAVLLEVSGGIPVGVAAGGSEAADATPGAKRPTLKGKVFAARGGGALSDMTLTALLRRVGWTDASGDVVTAHGFRSSFRDWVGEATAHPREVAEQALAHSLQNKVEAAYARSDLLAKRVTLMADWGQFCSAPPPVVVVTGPDAQADAGGISGMIGEGRKGDLTPEEWEEADKVVGELERERAEAFRDDLASAMQGLTAKEHEVRDRALRQLADDPVSAGALWRKTASASFEKDRERAMRNALDGLAYGLLVGTTLPARAAGKSSAREQGKDDAERNAFVLRTWNELTDERSDLARAVAVLKRLKRVRLEGRPLNNPQSIIRLVKRLKAL